jgi:hypothetical protein
MWAAPLLGVLSLAQVVGGEVDGPPGQGVANGEDGSGERDPDPAWLFTGKCPANDVCRNVPTKNIDSQSTYQFDRRTHCFCTRLIRNAGH